MSVDDWLPAAASGPGLQVEVRPGGVGFIRAVEGQEITIEIHRPLRPGSDVSLALATEERLTELRGRVTACEVIALGGEYGITYLGLVVLAQSLEWAGITHMGTSCP